MAFDAFLKIDGIPGESQDSKHKEWIEIISYSFGAHQQVAGQKRSTGGAAAGQRVDLHDLNFVKILDKASPKLFLFCCNGTHIPKVTIELCRATGDKTKYMEVKLEDVIVSTYRPGGSSHGDEALPLEEVSFNYGKIEYVYTATDHKSGKPAGDVKAHWSAVENKGG